MIRELGLESGVGYETHIVILWNTHRYYCIVRSISKCKSTLFLSGISREYPGTVIWSSADTGNVR